MLGLSNVRVQRLAHWSRVDSWLHGYSGSISLNRPSILNHGSAAAVSRTTYREALRRWDFSPEHFYSRLRLVCLAQLASVVFISQQLFHGHQAQGYSVIIQTVNPGPWARNQVGHKTILSSASVNLAQD